MNPFAFVFLFVVELRLKVGERMSLRDMVAPKATAAAEGAFLPLLGIFVLNMPVCCCFAWGFDSKNVGG